jgi:thiosulfate/3-mercaptopyruvate sulfurtransferase
MTKTSVRAIVFLLLLAASSGIVSAQQGTPATPANPGGVRSEMLVSTQWMADHLKDPNVVLLHLADKFSDYKRGHIPGARYLAMSDITTDDGPLNTELPAVEKLQKIFGDLGIGDNTRVVIYATNWFPSAARVYYTLDYLGHGDRTSLLDGGIEQWLAEDRPVTGEASKFSPAVFTPNVHANVRALLDEVKNDVDAKESEASAQIIDSRPPRRYTAGHLGGASNVYWMETLVSDDHPLLLAPDKLRALYASRGIVPGKKIVTYCEVGIQASHGYFLAKYLGYDAAMYDGSFQEWSAKNMPTVKGDAKR